MSDLTHVPDIETLKRTSRLPDDKKRILGNRDKMLELFAQYTPGQIGQIIGVGRTTAQYWLHAHRIPARARGEKPPGTNGRITRAGVREAVIRAYLRLDKCPLDCPGTDSCLDVGTKCIYERRE